MSKLAEAYEELDRISRYFDKNWMTEEYPTDALYEVLANMLAEQRAKKPVGG